MKSTIAACILAGLAVRLASATSQAYIDDYDKFKAPPITDGIGGLSNLPPVGLYHDLLYDGAQVGTNSIVTGTNGGVVAASQKNLALATGASITSVYDNSKVKCFSLVSFFLACTLRTTTGTASIAQGCTITVQGYRGKTPVGEETFSYVASNPLKSPMIFNTFPERFQCITNATFGVSTSATIPALTILKIDDLRHVNYH